MKFWERLLFLSGVFGMFLVAMTVGYYVYYYPRFYGTDMVRIFAPVYVGLFVVMAVLGALAGGPRKIKRK